MTCVADDLNSTQVDLRLKSDYVLSTAAACDHPFLVGQDNINSDAAFHDAVHRSANIINQYYQISDFKFPAQKRLWKTETYLSSLSSLS